MSPILQARSITKRFGSVLALESVDFSVTAGEIHALVGENGAGKTTLMRILFGGEKPDTGLLELEGKSVAWRDSAEASAHGIGMVSQHTSVIPELTCLENLVLGGEGTFHIPWSAHLSRAQDIARLLRFQIDWDAPASSLGPAGAQRLEIAQLIWRSCRIMILDEPTSMLSPPDVEAIYTNARELASQGVAVVVVTHRIPEVIDNCDRVTVMRGGKVVATMPVNGTSVSELAELVIGRSLPVTTSVRVDAAEPILKVEKTTLWDESKRVLVDHVSFDVRSHEIVGIAGVDGNGQSQLVDAIVGLAPVAAGSVHFIGRDMAGVPTHERIQMGLRTVSEDRSREAMIEDWSIVENAILGIQRAKTLVNRGVFDDAAVKTTAERVAKRLSVKFTTLDQPIGALSGGNQQRIVVSRALEFEPRLIVAVQPTRGLDIAASRDVFALMRDACKTGAGALIVSFDLDEILENCDRVLVMYAGRIFEPPSGADFDRAVIGRLMVGAT